MLVSNRSPDSLKRREHTRNFFQKRGKSDLVMIALYPLTHHRLSHKESQSVTWFGSSRRNKGKCFIYQRESCLLAAPPPKQYNNRYLEDLVSVEHRRASCTVVGQNKNEEQPDVYLSREPDFRCPFYKFVLPVKLFDPMHYLSATFSNTR